MVTAKAKGQVRLLCSVPKRRRMILPQNTPIDTITRAFLSFLPADVDTTGQLAEAAGESVTNRDWVPYLDDKVKDAWEEHFSVSSLVVPECI